MDTTRGNEREALPLSNPVDDGKTKVGKELEEWSSVRNEIKQICSTPRGSVVYLVEDIASSRDSTASN